MVQSIIRCWDRLIYKLAYPSLQRMFRNDRGAAYLFELYLRRYREQNPIPQATRDAVETFLDTVIDLGDI